MAKKEPKQLYGGKIPLDYLPAHNHVAHTPELGGGGFRRFWIPPQWVDNGWVECPCGWAHSNPKWRVHYAWSEHVEWWQTAIKEHGSLEAVHQHIRDELQKEGASNDNQT
jgi:hypothetical protein